MSNPRRKHRVVVEMTLDTPLTAREAAEIVQEILDERGARWRHASFKAKQYARAKKQPA